VVVIASHGTAAGIASGDGTIGPEQIADNLRYAGNVKLLHFSSCLAMKGDLPERMAKRLSRHARFPISGYKTSVDWAASAVIEFMYYELILSRGMAPEKAAEQIGILMPFSGSKQLPGTTFQPAGFRILSPGG